MGCRKRKYASTQDTFEYDPINSMISIECHVAMKDMYRVASGKYYAVPWPWHKVTSVSANAHAICNQIEDECERIAQSHGISIVNYTTSEIKHQFSKARQVLVICTKDEPDEESWKHAANEIQDLVDSELAKTHSTEKIMVEIRNQEMMYKDVSRSIIPESDAHKLCLQAEPIVEKFVSGYLTKYTTSIHYVNRQRRSAGFNVEGIPTVLIGIEPKLKDNWNWLEDQLVETLKEMVDSKTDLVVAFVPGRTLYLAGQIEEYTQVLPRLFLSQDTLPPCPSIGASISAHSCIDVGTLGVFVLFSPKGSTTNKLCILTCYHVIQNGATGDERLRNDKDGIALDSKPPKSTISIDYPGKYDADATKKRLQAYIDGSEDDDGSKAKLLKAITTREGLGGIGKVIHASGAYRFNKEGHQMDWAIIELHDQKYFQTNKPPAGADLAAEQMYAKEGTVPYLCTNTDTIRTVASVELGKWVCKHRGRTSGYESGDVNALKARREVMIMGAFGNPHKITSREVELVSFRGGVTLARPGDSGSMVFNIDKEWIGMVFAIDTTSDATYMTPAADIIEDIYKTCGTVTLP